MLRRGSAILAWLAAATSCGSEVVELELPVHRDMRTLLVGSTVDAALPLQAIDLEAVNTTPLPSVPEFAGSTTVLALYYDESLAELDLSPGVLPRVSDPAQGVHLPAFDLAYQASVQGGGEASFVPVDLSPDRVDFLLPKPPEPTDHCFEPEVRRVRREELSFMTAAITESDRLVLGFGREGHLLRVTPDEVTVELSERIPRNVASVARAPGGDLWLGDGLGRLWRGHPDRGFEIEFTRTSTSPLQWMDGPEAPTEANTDLFILTQDGIVLRYDNGVLEELGDVPTENRPTRGGVVHLGPATAAMIGSASQFFHMYQDSRLDDFTHNSTILARHVGLAQVADGRIAVLTNFGAVLEGTPLGLVETVEHNSGLNTQMIGSYRNGFIYSRGKISLVYGELDRVECELAAFNVPSAVRAQAQMGEWMVLFAPSQGDDVPASLEIFLVRPVPTS